MHLATFRAASAACFCLCFPLKSKMSYLSRLLYLALGDSLEKSLFYFMFGFVLCRIIKKNNLWILRIKKIFLNLED